MKDPTIPVQNPLRIGFLDIVRFEGIYEDVKVIDIAADRRDVRFRRGCNFSVKNIVRSCEGNQNPAAGVCAGLSEHRV